MNGSDYSLIQRIRQRAAKLANCTDEELRRRSLSLKYRATTGTKLESLIPSAFALVSESVRRTLDMTFFDVQLLGGIQLARGHIAEMKTGEGKTLTATLPTYVHALFEQGAHVVTVNDYLAQRDFESMGPVYQRLGLDVGCVLAGDSPEMRRAAYQNDITYGTAKEFGFDFLRDRMDIASSHDWLSHQSGKIMRDLHFVLVDEADSVLIDEARTPLVIGMIDSEKEERRQDCFRWASSHAEEFQETLDYEYDHERRKVKLANSGIEKLRRLPQNGSTRSVPIRQLYRYMENAIKVRRDFHLDQHYVVREGEVAIVDEFTGRVAEGRQWQGGIHQSVEAKEQIPITPATRQGATITLQSFFRRYRYFAGMTGTAWTSRAEFKRVYKKQVVRVPTNRPIRRTKHSTRVFADFESKMAAVVRDVKLNIVANKAVLIGTRSVETSELLSKSLASHEIEHQVLNANQHAQEAEIIAACGEAKKVTVATNMAGRGTDIILEQTVRDAGGLHVILTEIHESQRIDWQLIGRGSRQGDPGSYRIFVAIDDEIIRLGLGPQKAKRLIKKFERFGNEALPRQCFGDFVAAQRKLERKYLIDRMILLKQDNERQRRHFEMGLDAFCDAVQE